MGNTFKTGNYVNAIFQDTSNNIGIGGSPSGSYKLEVTGTAKVSSALTANNGLFTSFNTLGNIRLSSNPTGIEFYNTAGAVRNWQISAQSINDQSLDFTPSTANGGTTYSSPLLTLQGATSRVGINTGTTALAYTLDVVGGLRMKKSSPQAIFTVDGTTGLFIADGTNASWKSWQIGTSVNDGSDLSFTPSTNTSGTPTWGTTTVVFQGNGRVGIGITTPASLLSMGGAVSQASPLTYTPSIARQSFFNTYYSNSESLFPQYLDIVSYGQPDGTNGGGIIRFLTNPVTSSSAAVERMRITSSGGVGIGTTSVTGTTRLRAINSSAVQGDPLFFSDNGVYNAIGLYSSGADGYNGAACVMIMGRNTTNSRSINAGGSINASGNDYAEYMIKAIDDNIAKGDIVGVNAKGKLTNIFDDSISFVVKSTDPSYVGGDTWGNVDDIGKLPLDATDEQKAEHEAKIEEARAKVDRIAFSGQVPCNVYDANVGDYIIPIDDNGKIKGQAITNPTFEQYQISVGKVWKIMEDGRAWIAVKIG